MVEIIKSLTNDNVLRYVIFSCLYLESGDETGLSCYENNYAGIDITQWWGTSSVYFNEQYFCSNNNTPYVSFDDIEKCVEFLVKRWEKRMGNILNIDSKSITKFLILNNNTSKIHDINVYNTYNPTNLSNLENNVDKAINIYKGVNHI
jgi:hypothetical protein